MKIFITGASGYIGGSLAEHFRDIGHVVSGLVRTEENASKLRQRGIEPIVGDLSDVDAINRGARGSDATINTAEADEVDLLKPLISAVAGTGKALIHTSGSSIVVDDARGDVAGKVIFEDDAPFVPLPHRLKRVAVDHLVRTAGVTSGIRAVVICPTLIYGEGRGMKRDTHQIPLLARKSRERGAGVYIGKGAPIWSNVFIGDVMTLYALAVEKAPAGAFFFAENGEASWAATALAIARSLGLGDHTESWALEDAVAEVGGVASVALASNCRVRATNARRLLGWQPNGPSLADALASGS